MIENKTFSLTDFLNVTVKEAHDMLPEIKFPLVTIKEIQNTENSRFTDNNGEHVSDLSYQIECCSRNTTELEAATSAMIMGNVVNKLLTGPNYKLTRIGTPETLPIVNDKDVIRYILRYSCSIDLDKNTIYKRS